jgi:hypothetical protein
LFLTIDISGSYWLISSNTYPAGKFEQEDVKPAVSSVAAMK